MANETIDHFLWYRLDKTGYPEEPAAWSTGYLPHIYTGYLTFPPYTNKPDFCPVEYTFAKDYKAFLLLSRPAETSVLFSVISAVGSARPDVINVIKNHSALIEKELLQSKRISLFDIEKAMQDYDVTHPKPTGEIEPLQITSSTRSILEYAQQKGGLKSSLYKYTTTAVANHLMASPSNNINLLCSQLNSHARLKIAAFLAELLEYDCKATQISFTTEAPSPNYNDFFRLAVTQNGIYLPKNKEKWFTLDCSTQGDSASLKKVANKDEVYKKIASVYS